MILASFPSPDRSVWDLGPVPIRAYALCIIAGIIASIWIGERRWVARGGRRGTVSDIAVWAVIFGLIGGRLYHVITDNELYFREGRDPWRALYVWEGGLGVWGAIALGGVGAWIACRQRGIKLPPFADAVAPGIAVAQAIGRWGNYFNQELFGRPTDLPWAVEIDPDRPSTVAGATGYHPAFLYESLWNFALAAVLVYVDRRFKLGRGRVFALYVMGYTVGRVWIEMLRIDTANEILGLRVNVWTSVVVFLGGLVYFLLHRGPRETDVEPTPADELPTTAADADGDETTDAEDADNDSADDDEADDDEADDDAEPAEPAKPAETAETAEDNDGDADDEPAAKPRKTAEVDADDEPAAEPKKAADAEADGDDPDAESTAPAEPTAPAAPTAAEPGRRR